MDSVRPIGVECIDAVHRFEVLAILQSWLAAFLVAAERNSENGTHDETCQRAFADSLL